MLKCEPVHNEEPMSRKREIRTDADAWDLFDIFTVNTAMKKADPRHQAAWKRCRSKLVELAEIKTPTLRINPEMVDADGFLKPLK